MSVGGQYYHAKKRSEETPLDYLYRLNVAAIRAKIRIRDGSPEVRREHVEHFIGTQGNRDLAKQLTGLRLVDVDDLEATLRAYQRMESRCAQTYSGSNKFRPRPAQPASPTPAKLTRAVSTLRVDVEDSDSDYDLSGSDGDMEPRNVFGAAASDRPKKMGNKALTRMRIVEMAVRITS